MEAKQVKKINSDIFTSFIQNKNFFTAIIQLLLVFYAGGIAPTLPTPVLKFMSLTIPRIIAYTIVLIIAAYQPVTAIFASICIVITMQAIQKMNMEEKLMSIVKYKNENKTPKNCTCFCSDDELNIALEKHLEKKRKENIINTDVDIDVDVDNNIPVTSFDNKKHENNQHNDHKYKQENITFDNINDENNNYHILPGYELNNNTNKKQVSFSDHIFEEHLFNDPSPMISSDNGPKAFNSEGNKYMNLNDQETLLEKNINTKILSLKENINTSQNISDISTDDNSSPYSHNILNNIIPSHDISNNNVSSHDINTNNVPIHNDIINSIANINDKMIFDKDDRLLLNTHGNIHNINDYHLNDNKVESPDAKKLNNITGYAHNDDFAIF